MGSSVQAAYQYNTVQVAEVVQNYLRPGTHPIVIAFDKCRFDILFHKILEKGGSSFCDKSFNVFLSTSACMGDMGRCHAADAKSM